MNLLPKETTILVAGASGMVGSSLVRNLRCSGYINLLVPPRQELDLMDQAAVYAYLAQHRPDYIFIAAARVGGIQANDTYRAEFLHQNLTIQSHLIHGAHLAGIQRLMFLGSSCIYPKLAPQPIKEEYLLTGALEPTNEPYAIAKITGIKMCEAYNAQYGHQYVCVMPTNLYGPNDNYDIHNSHVIPALIRKTHEAKMRGDKELVVWGTGTPRREFLYVDDLAEACIHLMQIGYDGPTVNIGSGEDVTILELAETVIRTIGFEGKITFDTSKPDGTPRKLLDVTRLHDLGWTSRTDLVAGITQTYEDFLRRSASLTKNPAN